MSLSDVRAFETLERAVMDLLLAGDHPTLVVLRDQFSSSRVSRRQLTGVGFFTEIQVSDETPRVRDPASFVFGDVQAELEGLNHGAGFLLYVRNGVLHTLEGFTYDEPWPQQIVLRRLLYVPGPKRDLAQLTFTPISS